jgi:KUP system potassium uptake protein
MPSWFLIPGILIATSAAIIASQALISGSNSAQLKQLSQDDLVPKTCTHLVYLTKANHRHEIEEKIIKSIFSKKPKRASMYWFVHIDRTDQPYTLTYDVTELVEDCVVKINIHVGFRIQPKTELYFKHILHDLIREKSIDTKWHPVDEPNYNDEPDFKFVIIEKFLSVENEFSLRDGLLLNLYFLLKRMSQRDEKAFGIDKSDVIIEYIPLLYQPASPITLQRIATKINPPS